jgi:hypothetical protein
MPYSPMGSFPDGAKLLQCNRREEAGVVAPGLVGTKLEWPTANFGNYYPNNLHSLFHLSDIHWKDH